MSGMNLHVGLVGCGRWGKLILRDLLALGCEVSVVSVARAEAALLAGASRVCHSVEDLPREITGAVVATPTVFHAESIERLLPRGIPVFTEKPLTNDVSAARHLLELAPERIFVMDKWRYHPGVVELGAIARSGELGAVRSVRTVRLGWGSSHVDVDPVWILLPHDLSMLLEVLGFVPEPIAAAAHIENGEAVELSALLGGVPHVAVSISARHPVNQRAMTLCCERGTAILEDSYSTELTIRRTGDRPPNQNDAIENQSQKALMPLI